MAIDTSTGEITGAIRPALTTLRELPDVMDTLAIAIHDAIEAVRTHRKPGKITLTLTVEPWKEKSAKLIDEPVMIAGEVDTKLPKEDPPRQLFFVDEDGNATRTQRRQKGLELDVVAGPGVSAVG
jgi:hypothetical protein